MSFQFEPSSSEMICAMVEGDVLAHVGLAAGDRDNSVRRDRVPHARIEIAGGGERLIGAEQTGNRRIAEREAGGGGTDEERTAAEIGGLALGDFHVRIHVGLRSPALDAVRMSAAARMIAFWMRE